MKSIPAHILVILIRAYQFTFSAIMGKGCRYHPTCSHYAIQSVRRFGAGRGLILGLSRICRCHPWAQGGHDPIPEKYPLKKHAGCATKSPQPLERKI